MDTSYNKVALLFAGALALVCAGVWSVVYAQTPSVSGVLNFVVLDIGQGDSFYIESPTGVQMVVDGGTGDELLQVLPAVMPALDRSLDVVVATHPDADHIGGFSELLNHYEVGVFIEPGIPKDTATAKKLEQQVDEKQIPRVIARRGMQLDLGGGARLDILYPDRDVSTLPESRTNEGGIVARLVYGESEVLLMADVGQNVEGHLMSVMRSELDSDILKVGHHGSRFSTGATFVSAVSPDIAVISVGAKNTYGHPTEQVLTILKNAGAQILRTDQNGTIMCKSDGIHFSCTSGR